MTLYDFTQYENVIICGDIHARFEVIYGNPHAENTLFIVAGDCGFGFYETEYYHHLYNSKINRQLSKKGNVILFVRGNHDDPAFFDGITFAKKRAICIPDYSVVKTAFHNILCVGGAVSIDRLARKEKMQNKPQALFWDDEIAVFDAKKIKEITKAKIKIDTVVTHTAPSFCHPFSKDGIKTWLEQDENLAQDIDLERSIMDQLWNELKKQGHPISQWWYGHFHHSAWLNYENCYFRLLDENEMDYLKTT